MRQLHHHKTCDDGNAQPGDGCSGLCQLEPNFACPAAGQPCQSTVMCGDGKVSGVARAFEIAGGIRLLSDAGYDARLQRTLQDDPNLIALAIIRRRIRIQFALTSRGRRTAQVLQALLAVDSLFL